MIYVSSDMVYYDLYVRPLIHSVVRQIPWIHVHVHLILDQAPPTDLEAHERVTHSWEILTPQFIDAMPMSASTSRNEMNMRMLKTTNLTEIKKKDLLQLCQILAHGRTVWSRSTGPTD
jgi:hypothetical protein